jgi:hypothetical protein
MKSEMRTIGLGFTVEVFCNRLDEFHSYYPRFADVYNQEGSIGNYVTYFLQMTPTSALVEVVIKFTKSETFDFNFLSNVTKINIKNFCVKVEAYSIYTDVDDVKYYQKLRDMNTLEIEFLGKLFSDYFSDNQENDKRYFPDMLQLNSTFTCVHFD